MTSEASDKLGPVEAMREALRAMVEAEKAALTASEADGWVMVPKEATRAMCERGVDIFAFNSHGGKSQDAAMRAVWAAMIEAASKQEHPK